MQLKGKNYKLVKAVAPDDSEVTCNACNFNNISNINCNISQLLEIPPCSINGGSYILIEIKLKEILTNL